MAIPYSRSSGGDKLRPEAGLSRDGLGPTAVVVLLVS